MTKQNQKFKCKKPYNPIVNCNTISTKIRNQQISSSFLSWNKKKWSKIGHFGTTFVHYEKILMKFDLGSYNSIFCLPRFDGYLDFKM